MPRRRSNPPKAKAKAPKPSTASRGLRLVVAGVVGAAAVLPLSLNPAGYNAFGPIKAFVLASCAILVAAGLALDRDLLRTLTDRLRGSRLAWAAGALWIVIVLSTALSVDLGQSITGSYPEYSGVITWLAVTVIALGAASLRWTDSWDWVARSVTVSVTLMGCYAVIQFFGADPVLVAAGAAGDRIRATLGNSSNAGVYLLLATPFAIERLRSDESRAWRILAGVAAALALFMIVFSASRGAWVGLAVAAALWLFVESMRWTASRRRTVGLVALAVVVVLGAAVVAVPRLSKRIAPAASGTAEWRLLVWQAAGRITADRPLLGWGPNSFRYVYPSYRPNDVVVAASAGSTTGDPHNMVMSAAAALGVPGALGLLALIAAAGVACVASVRGRKDDDLRPVALAAALAGGLSALMFHYATLDTMPMIAVLLGLLVSAGGNAEAARAEQEPVWTTPVAFAVAGLFALVAVAVAGLVVADMKMGEALAASAQDAPWSVVDARNRAAQALAPWEPTFPWAIGKSSIQSVSANGDVKAYAEGQAALESVRESLPLDAGVVFDSAYLKMRFGSATRDAGLIREAHAVFVTLCDRDPYNPKYWSARGLAAAYVGDLAEAEKDLQTAVSLAPDKAEYSETLRQVQAMASSKN